MHDMGQFEIKTFRFYKDRNTLEVQQATHPTTNTPGLCILPTAFGLHNFYERDYVYIFIFWHAFLLQKRDRSTSSDLSLYYRKKNTQIYFQKKIENI